MGLLDGKRALVMGVGNKRSIAWGIATAFQREGAQLAFNYLNDRMKDNVVELVNTLPNASDIPVMPCDVSKQEEIDALYAELGRRWGSLDILVHSIAFAAIEDLKGRFYEISREGLKTAIDISAYSLVALTRGAIPLFEKAGGGSVMSLTFNAVERVVPSYNSMAMAKAVLEAETRYLAADLGPQNIRVNCISAGPLKTLAGSAVKGISAARDLMEAKAPLRRNITQEEVGNVAVFLASDWSRCVTGETIYADNGFNILGVTD
ncbi:MAG TPA: enoyl-ACP reductase [Candidatus Limnocylindria bacterium]|nr:enoyl-ACP reductase [Candidatus Limnocylindria bacterium]